MIFFYAYLVNRNLKLLLACDMVFALSKYGLLECTYFAQNHAFGYMILTIHTQDNADVNNMHATSTLDQYEDFSEGYTTISFLWLDSWYYYWTCCMDCIEALMESGHVIS